MKWGAPEHLVWLWLIPAFGALVLWLARRRMRLFAALAADAVRPELFRNWQPRWTRRKLWLWLVAFSLAVAALARPQWGYHWEEVRRRGLDIIVVLDTSRSMTAQDVKPNRLQQAKWGVRDFVKQLKGDRIGLVAFAGSSFLQCPLTMDYAAFLMTLDDVYSGIIPRGGTAIAQALREAMDSFETGTDADRAIILITDGDDLEGDPRSVVDDLKKAGIHVYAIGIGSREGELIPAPAANAGAPYLKDREGHVVKTALHEDVLEHLALSTGGTYVRSSAGDSGLERIFQEGLAHLKRGEGESKTIKAYEDRFPWLLGIAFGLLALEALLPERKRVKEVAP